MTSTQPTPMAGSARHWINGEWITSATIADSVSPSTGEVLGQYSTGGRAEAAAAIAAAREAFDAGVCLQQREGTLQAIAPNHPKNTLNH